MNKKLCANSDFNECLYNIALKGRYDVNELNIVSRKEFFAVNKKIRIIDFRLSAKYRFLLELYKTDILIKEKFQAF